MEDQPGPGLAWPAYHLPKLRHLKFEKDGEELLSEEEVQAKKKMRGEMISQQKKNLSDLIDSGYGAIEHVGSLQEGEKESLLTEKGRAEIEHEMKNAWFKVR